ncbi:Uncharacterised protein [Pragia fontium]|uniref:hypothetical protein n=1 Tax=Pragia fontium TaxID=82985 RepID=UPI000E010714|nr:hypothetical protein [Pragia fontium]SUB82002.1 Uncharacterised protein [Pragia fontium]
MQDAITRNAVPIKCKPEVLEGFYIRSAMQDSNVELAKYMGIHPSGASRGKQSSIKMASYMVARYGVPSFAVETRAGEEVLVMSSDGTQLTISKKEAQILLPLLNALRESQEKAPVAPEA